jgi:hypothetical protein
MHTSSDDHSYAGVTRVFHALLVASTLVHFVPWATFLFLSSLQAEVIERDRLVQGQECSLVLHDEETISGCLEVDMHHLYHHIA